MMYSFSVTEQLIVFLQSFGFGFIVGLLHTVIDFVFTLIMPYKRKNLAADIMFCLMFAFLFFCFVLAFILGKLRVYILIGVSLGIAVYSLAVGDFMSLILDKIQAVFRKLLHLVFSPCIAVLKRFKKSGKTTKKINKSIAKENQSGV